MSEKIPFDIEKWGSGEYDAVYRNGEKVIEILISKEAKEWGLISVTSDKSIKLHLKNGYYNSNAESNYDLLLTPKKKKGWVVVFINNNNCNLGAVTTNCKIELNNIGSNINKCGGKIIHESEFEY